MSLNLNTDAWYQISVTKFPGFSLIGTSLFRDGLTGSLFFTKTNTTKPGQRWQFYPYNSSVYVLRCEDGGPNAYLNAAKGTGNSSDHAQNVTGDTVPILANASVSDDSMFWQVEPWTDGTYYLSNLANGTNWRLNTQDSALLSN
ncbi:hypothetical protein N0V82_000418 [Gnomoniopsis sp. IMI 355080]|nr:hypothetical protein N0V82_000418 [Gnomoniopsis sp. IMI 355080]